MKTAIVSASLVLAALLSLAPGAHAQDSAERIIKFGHLNNADHPVSFGVKRFSELLAKKSGGKLTVREFPASTLGNEMQQQAALQGGVQEMSAPATTSLAGIVKEFGLVDLPFSIGSYAQADALLDGPLGQALIAKLPEKGLVALGYWDLGFRNVTNSKRPIAAPKISTASSCASFRTQYSSTPSGRSRPTPCRCLLRSCTGRWSRRRWTGRKTRLP